MNTRYRKSLIAGMIATLAAAPGWFAAQQAQAAQSGAASEPPTEYGQSVPGSVAPATESEGSSPADAALSAMTPDQVKGMDVVGTSGDKIGKIDGLVRNRNDGHLYAVIASGGILGIGAKKIPVALDALQLEGKTLHLPMTVYDLTSKAEYKEDQYVALKPEDKPIGEFAAFEANPAKGTGEAPAGGAEQAPQAEPSPTQ